MSAERRNARIESTFLGIEDHLILTAMLHLDCGDFHQGFGGYAFDTYSKQQGRRVGIAFGAQFIRNVLDTLEVRSWEKLPGTTLRIETTPGKVIRIGHFIKDQWFDPAEVAKEYQAS